MISDVATFKAYLADLGFEAPSDADAQIALNRGSQHILTNFTLVVDLTDQIVIDAAHVASSFELNADGTVSAAPGFWVRPQTGKILTRVEGISWEQLSGGRYSDGVSPADLVAASLKGAIAAQGFLQRA